MKIPRIISIIYKFLYGIKFSDNSELTKINSNQTESEKIITESIENLNTNDSHSSKSLKYIINKFIDFYFAKSNGLATLDENLKVLQTCINAENVDWEGIANIPFVDQVGIEDENTGSTNEIVSPERFWQGIARFLVLKAGTINGLATLDGTGKLTVEQTPSLAIEDFIFATENTIADFAANSGSYTFEKGDVIFINTTDIPPIVFSYFYTGGTKTNVNSYSLISTTYIPWANVTGKPIESTATQLEAEASLTDSISNLSDLKAITQKSIRWVFDKFRSITVNFVDGSVQNFQDGAIQYFLNGSIQNFNNLQEFNNLAIQYFNNGSIQYFNTGSTQTHLTGSTQNFQSGSTQNFEGTAIFKSKPTLPFKQNTNPGISADTPVNFSDIDFNYVNRTLTISRVNGSNISSSNPLRFFIDGTGDINMFEKTSAIQFTWANSSGQWYFYFDSSGNPQSSQTAWTDFNIVAPVYIMTWNASETLDSDKPITHQIETHLNDISAAAHLHFHLGGAIWRSGLDIVSNFLSSGTPNADGRNTCISLTSGYALDDNLLYNIINSTNNLPFNIDAGNTNPAQLTYSNSANLRVRYKGASGLPKISSATRFPFLWNSVNNKPQYVNTSGTLTDVSNNYFFVYFAYVIQDPRYGNCIRLTPYYGEFATSSEADTISWESVQAQDEGAKNPEIRPLYKLKFETKSTFDAAIKYTCLRSISDIRTQRTTIASSASGSLPATNVTYTPTGNIAATNVQSAITELDSEKAGLALSNTFTGYNKFGSDAPAIKIKKLTGTTANTQGNATFIPHELSVLKIISITSHVYFSNSNAISHSSFQAGFQFDLEFNKTDIIIVNHPSNSSNILSKPITITIIYEE